MMSFSHPNCLSLSTSASINLTFLSIPLRNSFKNVCYLQSMRLVKGLVLVDQYFGEIFLHSDHTIGVSNLSFGGQTSISLYIYMYIYLCTCVFHLIRENIIVLSWSNWFSNKSPNSTCFCSNIIVILSES